MPGDLSSDFDVHQRERRKPRLQLRPVDPQVPILNQLGEDLAPVILINVFTVDAAEVPALLKAWEDDANWMKSQAGYISTQLHRGIAGSCVFLN